MALIGTESRPDEETNESVRLAAKAIATRLKMNEKVEDYFRKQGSGPLPARHHVLHSTMERAGLNSDLDLAGSASVGGALATHSYSDFRTRLSYPPQTVRSPRTREKVTF